MSVNPHVTEHAINEAMCRAWIPLIEGANTKRQVKQRLLKLLFENNYAEFDSERQTLLGDNHGEGLTWKPAFMGFWRIINTLFSWLFGVYEPAGSPLYRALLTKIEFTPLQPLPAPENLETLLRDRQYYTLPDFHQYLKAFAGTSPESFIENFTNHWKTLPEDDKNYRFLYMDVLVECLLNVILPGGNEPEHKADVLQELLLALVTSTSSLPVSYAALQSLLPQENTASNLELLESRLGQIQQSYMPPLVEHTARRGVERLLSALPLSDEDKNECLHQQSTYRRTITALCTKVLKIRSPAFTEDTFANLTFPMHPATPFGDYYYVSHGAFAISLAFIRNGLEGALYTFFDAVNRSVVETEPQRAYVLAQLHEIPAHLVTSMSKLKTLTDIVTTTPLTPMTGTEEDREREIDACVKRLTQPSGACQSKPADDRQSAHLLCSFGAFATLPPGTPQQTAPTPKAPGTATPGTGCQ